MLHIWDRCFHNENVWISSGAQSLPGQYFAKTLGYITAINVLHSLKSLLYCVRTKYFGTKNLDFVLNLSNRNFHEHYL